MIGTASDGSARPCIDDIEDERSVNSDGGMQAIRRLPCAIANSGDKLSVGARWMERDPSSIASDHVPRIDHAVHAQLNAFQCGIDVAHRATGAWLFA